MTVVLQLLQLLGVFGPYLTAAVQAFTSGGWTGLLAYLESLFAPKSADQGKLQADREAALKIIRSLKVQLKQEPYGEQLGKGQGNQNKK